MDKPEKIVMVGDMLTTDILFGNLNNMATVWITDNREYFRQDKI